MKPGPCHSLQSIRAKQSAAQILPAQGFVIDVEKAESNLKAGQPQQNAVTIQTGARIDSGFSKRIHTARILSKDTNSRSSQLTSITRLHIGVINRSSGIR